MSLLLPLPPAPNPLALTTPGFTAAVWAGGGRRYDRIWDEAPTTKRGAATSTLFWPISRALLSFMAPDTRRVFDPLGSGSSIPAHNALVVLAAHIIVAGVVGLVGGRLPVPPPVLIGACNPNVMPRFGAPGTITAVAGVGLFKPSKLGNKALRKIWDLCDVTPPHGQLTRDEFMTACKLIALGCRNFDIIFGPFLAHSSAHAVCYATWRPC